MKNSKLKLLSVFFISLLFSLFVTPSHSSPSIKKIENLLIETVPENGEYRINVSFKLGYPFYKCRRVIEKLELYPLWVFNGINEMGRSRVSELTQNNFKFISKEGRDSLVFDYDVRLLLFHFIGNLDIALNKSFLGDGREVREGRLKGTMDGETKFVKEFKGELDFKSSEEGKTSVICKLTIKPASLAYRVIPYKTLKRVVASRLTKICENLNREVFTRGHIKS